MPPDTYLGGILAAHRARAAADAETSTTSWPEADGLSAATRPFARSLATPGRGSAGGDRRGQAALAVERARSTPISTPAAWPATTRRGVRPACRCSPTRSSSGGSAADLAAARAACGLPVLRKDFTVSDADVCDARLMGADAVLLIVAALSDAELLGFSALARELALDALVEVHDEAELERALDAGAELVGVNQRDLTTFAVDPGRAVRVVRAHPARGGGGGRVGHPGPDRRPAPGRRRLPGGARGGVARLRPDRRPRWCAHGHRRGTRPRSGRAPVHRAPCGGGESCS